MVLISNRLLLGSNSLDYDICGYSKEHYVHSYYVSVETIGFQEGNNLFPIGGSNKERISAPGGSNSSTTPVDTLGALRSLAL